LRLHEHLWVVVVEAAQEISLNFHVSEVAIRRQLTSFSMKRSLQLSQQKQILVDFLKVSILFPINLI
jgi:hypothetical protein